MGEIVDLVAARLRRLRESTGTVPRRLEGPCVYVRGRNDLGCVNPRHFGDHESGAVLLDPEEIAEADFVVEGEEDGPRGA